MGFLCWFQSCCKYNVHPCMLRNSTLAGLGSKVSVLTPRPPPPPPQKKKKKKKKRKKKKPKHTDANTYNEAKKKKNTSLQTHVFIEYQAARTLINLKGFPKRNIF